MTIRPIVTIGEKVLRANAQRIDTFDQNLHCLLDDMLETMIDGRGVGLAAPQVGISQQVIIIRLLDDRYSVELYGVQAGVLYEAINPRIIRTSQQKVDGVEGCLSIPGYAGNVLRYESVVVRAQNRNGEPFRIEIDGWLARVFQHEIDHLKGILFIDIASKVWNVEEGSPQAIDRII